MLPVSITLFFGSILGLDSAPTASTQIVQMLDLRGEWEGHWYFESGKAFSLEAKDGSITACDGTEIRFLQIKDIVDEGGGNLRVKWYWSKHGWAQGIYRQEGDRLCICFFDQFSHRPKSFDFGTDRHVLYLQRNRKNGNK